MRLDFVSTALKVWDWLSGTSIGIENGEGKAKGNVLPCLDLLLVFRIIRIIRIFSLFPRAPIYLT